MTEYELADCLSNLLHLNFDVDEMSTEHAAHVLYTHLPENINIDTFMSHLMGIPKDSFDEILSSWEEIRRTNSPRKTSRKNDTSQSNYKTTPSLYAKTSAKHYALNEREATEDF